MKIGSCGYKKLLLYCQSSNETVCITEEKSLLVKPLKEDYCIEYILRTQKICIKKTTQSEMATCLNRFSKIEIKINNKCVLVLNIINHQRIAIQTTWWFNFRPVRMAIIFKIIRTDYKRWWGYERRKLN